jgi:hypothetical protein
MLLVMGLGEAIFSAGYARKMWRGAAAQRL